MYIVPEFIDMGLTEGRTWPTPAHRKVAQVLFLGNPNINKLDQLIASVSSLINANLTEEELGTITLSDLSDRGVIF